MLSALLLSGRRKASLFSAVTVMMVLLLVMGPVVNQQPLRVFLRSVSRSLQDDSVETTHGASSDVAGYQPAPLEAYIIYEHMDDLGYNTHGDDETAEGCKIWNDPTASAIYDDLHTYRRELERYWDAVKAFTWVRDQGIVDLRQHLNANDEKNNNVCQQLQLQGGEQSLQQAFFPSGQLSRMMTHQKDSREEKEAAAGGGWLEPLAPPMRHPNFCMRKTGNILNIEYLVHDFAALCHELRPTSRVVLFDLGGPKQGSPMWTLVDLFHQFGFKFDHIYAFESRRVDSVADLYDRIVPDHARPAYHLINTAPSSQVGHDLNPWSLLEAEYTPDDLILVKMDMDGRSSGSSDDESSVELRLVQQLLNSPRLLQLVDHFYFEHLVQQEENRFWRKHWSGSIKDTLQLFRNLRERGVAAHFWV